MSRTTDIVIIGAGIIGAAIAFELGKIENRLSLSGPIRVMS